MTASNSSMTSSSGRPPAVRSMCRASSVRSVPSHADAGAVGDRPRRGGWQNVASSASTGWARYQIAGCSLRCTSWPTAVVLPAPAGPTTIVSGTSQARSSRRSTRSRTIARTAGGSRRALGRRAASMARRRDDRTPTRGTPRRIPATVDGLGGSSRARLTDGSGRHPRHRHRVGRARRGGAPAGPGAQPGPAGRVLPRRGGRRAVPVLPGRAAGTCPCCRARRPRSRSRSARRSAPGRRPARCRSPCAPCPRSARRRRRSPRDASSWPVPPGCRRGPTTTTRRRPVVGQATTSSSPTRATPPARLVRRRPRPGVGASA